MIRIAFLIRSLEYGGSERQLAALVNGLDPKRFDVSVITFYAGGALEEEFTNKNINLFCLRKRGRWELFGFLWRLVQELRAIRPDILHSYLVEPNSRLRRLAESEGIADRIVWAGERSDVAAVYNAVNIVCSSSSGEGFPNAIAEANGLRSVLCRH